MNHIIQKGCLLMLAMAPYALNAQASPADSLLNRTVVVEQEYNPEIMDASKINRLPLVKEPSVAKQDINYSMQSHPAVSFPSYQPLQTIALQEPLEKTKRGYIRLGYGNRGNMDGRIGYLFQLSDKDELGIWGGIRGMNGKVNYPKAGKQKRHEYRSSAHISYLHQFNKTEMRISGQWGLQNFGLHPLFALTHQRFTTGHAHWHLKSKGDELPLLFTAEANWNMHQRIHNWTGNRSEEIKATEHQVYTHATLSGLINEQQRISLRLQMHNLLYQNHFFTDYTSLQLNPFYELQNERWKLRAGVHADVSLGFGKAIQIAPDVYAQATFADSYLVYIKAEGGRTINNFDRLATFCPYATLWQGEQLKNTYEQVNAALGFKASPYAELHFHLFGGYQKLKDELYQHADANANLTLQQANANNFYAGLTFQYNHKDLLTFTGEGIYRHWDMTEEALLFKPSVSIHTALGIHPVKPLYLHIAYQYCKPQVEKTQQAVVHNLKSGASYTIIKGLSVYVSLDNLLNKTYSYYWNYPEQGFQVLGGLSFRF